ncbi:MAG: hypothetical protein ACE5D8_04915 [Fidelibacterota bacterium]
MVKKFIFGILILQFSFSQGTWQWSGRTHPELKWRTLVTEHFNVHYHEGIEDLARQGASIAEQVLPVLLSQMGLESIPRIDITFTAEDEVMNGYALFSRMVFIWVDQNDAAIWLEDEKWLYQVTAHELQHIVLMEAVKSWMPEPFGLLTSGIPGWFIEGTAEFYTERWRPYRADLAHKWHTLKRKEDNMNPHHDGFSKLLYLADQFGDSSLIHIVQYRNKLKLFNFKDGFKKATGLTTEQFEEDWRRHMNTYYYGYRAQKERIRDIGELFTLPLKSMVNVMISPDSLHMAVIGRKDEDQGDLSLFILSRDTTKKKKNWFAQLIPGKATEDSSGKKNPAVQWDVEEVDFGRIHSGLSWSPDSKQLAYSKYHYGKHQTMIWDIGLVDVTTGKRHWLTKSQRANQPAWSPDGKDIVYVAHHNSTSDFFRIPAQGGEPQQLTHNPYDTQLLSPAFSPDGKLLAYGKAGPDGNMDIYTLAIATGEEQRLTENPDVDYLPVWHPDGKHITYTSHRGSTPNLYTIALNPANPTQVTDVGDAVWSAQWIPGDTTILARTLSDVDSIRLARVDPFRVPTASDLNFNPVFTDWRRHKPVPALPTMDLTWPITVKEDRAYRFTRHIKHLTSYILPLDYIQGMTVWSDAMGRHIFQAAVFTDWNFRYPAWLFSYLNAASGPLWGFDYMEQINYIYQTYENHPLWEAEDGVRLWASQTWNAGYSLATNHTLRSEFRFLNRTAYFDIVSKELPNPDSGREGRMVIDYRWVSRRPFRSNQDLPRQGWGLNLTYSLSSEKIYGEFNYSRFRLDAFRNIGLPTGALFIRSRYQSLQGSNPPGQELVGLTDDWVLYLPGASGALLGYETMNPRGWEGIRLGDQAYMTTVELRLPFLDKFPIINVLGFTFGSITAAVYSDYANAWYNGITPEEPIFTAGGEARIAIAVQNMPIVIVSYGTGQLIEEWKQDNVPNNYLRFALINPF